MSKLSLWKKIPLVCAFCALDLIASPAQTFTTLINFNGTNGAAPFSSLVQGTDGNFYGTTVLGGVYDTACGTSGCGTVFRITSAGKLTTLYKFCVQANCTDGYWPYGGLVLGSDGNFYGTTAYGGSGGPSCNPNGAPTPCDTVFRITPAGTLTTLYSFCSQAGCTDGASPEAGLVLGLDRNFYGTTLVGGINHYCPISNGCGTVFKIAPGGNLATLYSFCAQTNCADGYEPAAPVIQATDGNFYGTTSGGGSSGNCPEGGGLCGTIFKITPGGTLTTVHSFDGADGNQPYAALVQATDGNLYGTATYGGANSAGTIFKTTLRGVLTTLHSFDGTDGQSPLAPLIQATDGNFYGTTCCGGTYGYGTTFAITSAGALTTLRSFDHTDGSSLFGALLQATSGGFYGATDAGGTYDHGTVFSLSLGLGPFVETVPTSGKVGATVIILGDHLKGTLSVTFNGTAAGFKVVSSSEIKTTVPKGATTGKVNVVTPGGTLSSNVNFGVL